MTGINSNDGDDCKMKKKAEALNENEVGWVLVRMIEFDRVSDSRHSDPVTRCLDMLFIWTRHSWMSYTYLYIRTFDVGKPSSIKYSFGQPPSDLHIFI